MLRQMVVFDEEKCTGCGLCAKACLEGAIAMVDGKARLVRDDFCDGMGNCLPACPAGAISFVMREAPAFDAEAAEKHMQAEKQAAAKKTPDESAFAESALEHWPVQIRLAPVNAPYFSDADILVAADCTAYAFARFHEKFMRGRVVLIGCTKLDGFDYAGKLSAILGGNAVRSICVVRMDVPCCGGMERAVADALAKCGRCIPCTVTVIGRNGRLLSEGGACSSGRPDVQAGFRTVLS